MIILDYLQVLKRNIANYEQYESFNDVLIACQKVNFNKKDVILSHFNNININQNKDKSLIILKYNTRFMMKRSWDEFYKIVRGLTIDWRNCRLVLYPFDKFYELDENQSVSFNKVKKLYEKPNAIIECTDKIDGSLIIARYYEGNLLVSSSGQLQGTHVDIAKNIISRNPEHLRFIKDFSNYTLIFEMKNTKFPQLVKYNEDSLTLIGMRDMNTLNLLYNFEIVNLAQNYDINVVKLKKYTLTEIMNIVKNPCTSGIEGFVLRINDFMVKIKTTNYILANRFMSDAGRNFNMVVKCITEGRLNYVRPLIRVEYIEGFDLEVLMFNKYLSEKNNFINKLYESFDESLDIDIFKSEIIETYPKYLDVLINKRAGNEISYSKDDISFLRKYADYFGCLTHFKYAEANNIPVDVIEKDIENGKLEYIFKFSKKEDNKNIYIINKWQFIDLDKICFIE